MKGSAVRVGRSLAAAGATAAVLACSATSAAAQSVNDYRLPGATSTPDPRAQGPVDPDAPVVRRDTVPSPRPSSAPGPTATIAPDAVPSRTVTPPASARTRLAPAPASSAPPLRQGTAIAASPGPASTEPVASASLDPGVPSTAVPAVEPATATPLPPAEPTGLLWPWIAAAFAGLVGLLGLIWWRRRNQPGAAIDFEVPMVREDQPLTPRAAATPAPPPEPEAVSMSAATGSTQGQIDIALEARRLSASLMATTLNYRLVVTNRGSQALSALAVEGDMVSAHASLPPEQQIANEDQRMALRHALVSLGPGESTEFTGDLRLPLTEVTPIRAGEATFFVPLARLRVEAMTATGEPLVAVQTYVVGELPDNPGAALRPFRLDLGPRTYSRIGQRAVG